MKIGELATRTGTEVQTIRYYERAGLMPAAPRSDANYRQYGPGHIERLGLIRRARALDMTLDEIRLLLHFKDSPQEGCAEVNALLDEHIGHVAQRIRELRALEKELKSLRARCATPHSLSECGILTGIDRAAAAPLAPTRRRHVHGAH